MYESPGHCSIAAIRLPRTVRVPDAGDMAARGDGRSAVPDTVLHGRGRELDAIRTLITAARTGSGGVLVVEGEPGAGKSALLDAAAQFAPDFEVLRTRGIQSEAEFAFSGLAELLAPLSELMDGQIGR